ncbi:hypothetical protein [Brevifollis gellanilyticus]|uniref:Uncharacterized protein n=1 Tax=Brevifollis gellanilyticus TaxID=748831 RepID=A0A512M4P5_9BACT|nr:hypothetical protein [Brevifollis gellanilyticus]GEP41705.1 hypothetical protein BGE01nite_09960 [Brevifollis gellanilyticus]
MSIAIPDYLRNHDQVVTAFGRWPSFHDGYLLRWEMQDDFIELEVEGWNLTSEVDERGYFITEKHHRVVFRFEGVHDADLEGLKRCDEEFGTNILFGLVFAQGEDGAIEVQIESAVGGEFEGGFRARRGAVVSVTPSPI